MRARLSPDGKRAALQLRDQRHQIWIWDFARETPTRLTFDADAGAINPLWTLPEGRHIVFGLSYDGSTANIYRRLADGTGMNEQLTFTTRVQRGNVISPDGQYLVFEAATPTAGYDFMLLSLQGTPRMEPLFGTPFDERDADISPDGRWIAYESNLSGQSQVYVRPFPNVNDAFYQISNDGGRTPVWSPTGRELFFVDGASIMAVAVQLTPTIRAGTPLKLFDAPSLLLDGRFAGSGTVRTFDISRDGKQFLMIKESVPGERDLPHASMIVWQNWLEELKAKLTGR